jgi:phosphoglycolate phosphatase
MNRAFEEVFGRPRAFDGVQMAGRTDKWILQDAASRAGVQLSVDGIERFRRSYLIHLDDALAAPHPAKRVLPGVARLLEETARLEHLFPSLLTGNSEDGARIKLEHFDLWKFFASGAYGDDVVDRNHLFGVALERARLRGCTASSPSEVVIIGDTALDVACARAAGAWSIAVATGPSDVQTLRQSGADLVVETLDDTEKLLRFFERPSDEEQMKS